jgi:hypothetical protein
MTFSAAASGAARLASTQDFSLVLGGPLFQLLRRLRLSDDAGGLLRRRVVFYVMITWTPLLVFSAAQGQLFGRSLSLPFLYDIECHLRSFVAGPLLLISELIVHRRLPALAGQFQIRGLVRPDQTRASPTR